MKIKASLKTCGLGSVEESKTLDESRLSRFTNVVETWHFESGRSRAAADEEWRMAKLKSSLTAPFFELLRGASGVSNPPAGLWMQVKMNHRFLRRRPETVEASGRPQFISLLAF